MYSVLKQSEDGTIIDSDFIQAQKCCVGIEVLILNCT